MYKKYSAKKFEKNENERRECQKLNVSSTLNPQSSEKAFEKKILKLFEQYHNERI